MALGPQSWKNLGLRPLFLFTSGHILTSHGKPWLKHIILNNIITKTDRVCWIDYERHSIAIKKCIHFNYYQFTRYDYYVTINQLSGFISFVTFSPWTSFHSLNLLSKQIPTLNKTLMLNQYLIPCLCFPISNCFNHIDQPILWVDGMWPLLAGHKNTDIFIRLSYYSRVDNAFQLEVCFSVYILIS